MIKVFIKSLKLFGFVAGFSLTSVKQRQQGLDASKKLVDRIIDVPVHLVMVALPDTMAVGPMQDMVPCLSPAEIEELITSTPPPTEEELKEAEEPEKEADEEDGTPEKKVEDNVQKAT